MPHECTIISKSEIESRIFVNGIGRKIQRYLIVSENNPLGQQFFRSSMSLRQEQKRQLEMNQLVAHPFSAFKCWYDLYLMILYLFCLILKPMQHGFLRRRHYKNDFFFAFTFLVDTMCCVDVVISFFTGYVITQTKSVELRRRAVARHYLTSCYFLADVLSSIPVGVLYRVPKFNHFRWYLGVFYILVLFKIVRLVTMIGIYQKALQYRKVKSAGTTDTMFIVYSSMIVLIVIHWMTCLQYGIPRLARNYFSNTPISNTIVGNGTWFSRQALSEKSLLKQYTSSFFKSSAYILGVRITKLQEQMLPEEYMLGVFTYFLGKIVIGFLWIVLAVAILNSRAVDIKFSAMMNQLDEYMARKQLPMNLRNKIVQYYNYKYQRKYLNEEHVASMLSNNLKKRS
ncbi:hypothetical protein NQ317_007279 [Molorchus minor]|uniref:Ion transport domain-containing protein n=1 Tax=Molorchus minor TaxID=1323400 RepID=A0ABQ9JW14_9CUCU|nr:hypothetical protein NQ317_007279 [Molorchus minor]